ncbi:hypothetical protein KJ866_01790 [Patescibacteria group bacterium]|nr:hypothetical protein [Patescibacteria group bacterium]MBU2219568.1 hypothetical protein [Patescibacteria group bacterium]MBU2264897.1 hypothetical protein [Patescibacteria group bacterium]
MEKIQSIGIGRDCITMMFGDGENEELKRCPFSVCGLYHSTDLAVCPTTGKPIAEELKRLAEEVTHRRKAAINKELAEAARKAYEKERLPEWREKLPRRLSILALVIMVISFLFIPFIPLKNLNNSTVGIGAIVFFIIFLWFFWEDRRQRRIKKKANEIYDGILIGKGVKKETGRNITSP